MKAKVLRGTAALFLIVFVVACPVATLIVQHQQDKREREELTQMALTIAANYEPGADIQAHCREISWQSGGMWVNIVALDGEVLADSSVDPNDQSYYNIADREEIQQAGIYGVGFSRRRSVAYDTQMSFAAAKTQHGVYIRIAKEYTSFFSKFISLLPAMLIACGLGILVAVPRAFHFASSIRKPIALLSTNMGQVVKGGGKLKPQEYDFEELKSLASNINRMSDEVDEMVLRIESEHQKVEAILGNTNEGFVMLDENEKLLLINDAACAVLGCDKSALGHSLLHATRNSQLLDAVLEVQTSGKMSQLILSDAGGKKYDVTIVTGRIDENAPAGTASAIVMVLSDITDRHNAIHMRQDFFQAASHELKTPITSIRGFAEILNGNQNLDDEKRAECAERMLKESVRMQNLIDDIMMISRLESGEVIQDRELMDFGEVVNMVCEDINQMAPQYSVQMEWQCEPCEIIASQRELEELANNLVSNALKYNVPHGRIEVQLYKQDDKIVLTVFNTGEAIPNADVYRIFERFVRLDKGRSKSVGGTGLGLAIVQQIAMQYGGTATVKPHEGVGNTFRVELPLYVPPTSRSGDLP